MSRRSFWQGAERGRRPRRCRLLGMFRHAKEGDIVRRHSDRAMIRIGRGPAEPDYRRRAHAGRRTSLRAHDAFVIAAEPSVGTRVLFCTTASSPSA
jgi:hypothetical protein